MRIDAVDLAPRKSLNKYSNAAVGQLADGLPVSRPAVSQHLKVLKDAGLITDRAAGTRRLSQVAPAGLAVLRTYLDQFWDRALEVAKRESVIKSGRSMALQKRW